MSWLSCTQPGLLCDCTSQSFALLLLQRTRNEANDEKNSSKTSLCASCHAHAQLQPMHAMRLHKHARLSVQHVTSQTDGSTASPFSMTQVDPHMRVHMRVHMHVHMHLR